jgi:hypothetical protein
MTSTPKIHSPLRKQTSPKRSITSKLTTKTKIVKSPKISTKTSEKRKIRRTERRQKR